VFSSRAVAMKHRLARLLGNGPAVAALREAVRLAAASDARVLIRGESGVGKALVAASIHSQSERTAGPLVTIDCARTSGPALESELFGRAADTSEETSGLLERADGGTAFIAEIGKLSLEMQALILRFLQSGEIHRIGASRAAYADVRTIAGTSRDLGERTETKEFREDLYYRLNVIQISVAPLRQRAEDVPLLLHHFLRTYSEQYGGPSPRIDAGLVDRLSEYRWPGNVRELKQVAELLVVRYAGRLVTSEDVQPLLDANSSATADVAAAEKPIAERALDRMTRNGESFWSAVHQPFRARDLSRTDVRHILYAGLAQSGGSYPRLAALFHVAPADYRRFLAFLRREHVATPGRLSSLRPALASRGVPRTATIQRLPERAPGR
jgi:DNA-binding NtrC family response regulator